MIESRRLRLRPWSEQDLAPFAVLNADPAVTEHFPARLTPAEGDALAGRIQAAIQEHGFGFWAVEVRGGAPFVGFVGLARPSFEAHFTPAVEVGWRLARPHWGQGYATEAASAALDHAFGPLGLAALVSFTAAGNTRSRRVMERLGFTRDPAEDFDHPRIPEGHPVRPHVLYRLAAEDWRGPRAYSTASPG